MRIARLPPSRRVWIFDLDNTLHDARARIFPAMHEQINAYLRRYFGVDAAGADEIRTRFWRTYGTTLNGLMRHHGADPRHFLRETHVFPELADMVVHENALKHALRRLGGVKLVFSNAPRHYVEEVLDHVRTGDADLAVAHSLLTAAADFVGLVRDAKAAELIRRRAATACLAEPPMADED